MARLDWRGQVVAKVPGLRGHQHYTQREPGPMIAAQGFVSRQLEQLSQRGATIIAVTISADPDQALTYGAVQAAVMDRLRREQKEA